MAWKTVFHYAHIYLAAVSAAALNIGISLYKLLTCVLFNANMPIQLYKTLLKASTLRKKMVAYLG